MAKRILLYLFICFVLHQQISAEVHNCVQKNPCLCRFSDYEKIDLTPLAKQDFFNVTAGNLTYFYHVCEDGNLDPKKCDASITTNNCTNASICVCDATNKTLRKIASVRDSTFTDIVSEKYVQKLVFKEKDKTLASVILVCSDYSETILHSVSVDSTNGYEKMILFSPHACLVTESPGLSTGTVLLIIVFFAVLVYFILGALLLRCLRGAHGLEMIPNLDFWRDLPGLVRDGTIFLLSGCKPTTIVTTEVYDRI